MLDRVVAGIHRRSDDMFVRVHSASCTTAEPQESDRMPWTLVTRRRSQVLNIVIPVITPPPVDSFEDGLIAYLKAFIAL